MVRALAKVAPTLPLRTKIDVEACSRDPSEVAKLQTDPLFYPKVTVRFIVEFDAAVSRVEANAHRINLPLLVLVGSADAIIPPQASIELCNAAGTEDKTLKTYEGGYHQPILDTNRDEVLSDIGAWISTHTETTPSAN
jgi:alpha-beta hydrolase superfamily lysophospholipase